MVALANEDSNASRPGAGPEPVLRKPQHVLVSERATGIRNGQPTQFISQTAQAGARPRPRSEGGAPGAARAWNNVDAGFRSNPHGGLRTGRDNQKNQRGAPEA
jgi:hypothetical protein